LVCALLKRAVQLLESLTRNRVFQVEPVGLFHLAFDPPLLRGQLLKNLRAGRKLFVSFGDVTSKIIRRKEEGPELFDKHPLKIVLRDLGPAFLADVLGGV
jgi:hypothetical protein